MRVIYDDGSKEDVYANEIEKMLLSNWASGGDYSSDEECEQYITDEDSESIVSIAKFFDILPLCLVWVNRKRFPELKGNSILRRGTTLIIPDERDRARYEATVAKDKVSSAKKKGEGKRGTKVRGSEERRTGGAKRRPFIA